MKRGRSIPVVRGLPEGWRLSTYDQASDHLTLRHGPTGRVVRIAAVDWMRAIRLRVPRGC